MRSIILIILASVFIAGCANQSANNLAVSEPPKPTPEPTRSNEEIAQENQADEIEAHKVLDTYLAANYNGWTIQGDTLSEADTRHLTAFSHKSSFEVHLFKGDKSKVITLVLEDFFGDQNRLYWHVYRPTSLQLGDIELESVKEIAEERGKEAAKEE